MLTINSDNTIELTRGDSAYLTVSIVNEATGEAYTMLSTDVLTLSVKESIDDTDYAFQVTNTGTNSLHIVPSNTKSLDVGSYKYDVQLETGTDVYTIIAPARFKITKEVT